MSPKLVSDDGRHVVIRPLAYVEERDLAAYAEDRSFPIIPCDLCGSQENLQRKQVKAMLREWEKKHPGRVDLDLQRPHARHPLAPHGPQRSSTSPTSSPTAPRSPTATRPSIPLIFPTLSQGTIVRFTPGRG